MDGVITIGKREAVDLLLAHHRWLRECETLALAHPNQVATGAARLPDHIKHWWVCGSNSRPPSWPRLLQLYRNPSEARTSCRSAAYGTPDVRGLDSRDVWTCPKTSYPSFAHPQACLYRDLPLLESLPSILLVCSA